MLGPSQIEATYAFDEVIDAQVQDAHQRRNLCLLVKEALNNIAKYSGATLVLVEGRLRPEGWMLQIGDNGCGFDITLPTRGNGLRHLRSRAVDIVGECVIVSAPGQGTLITCLLPLPTSREQAHLRIG